MKENYDVICHEALPEDYEEYYKLRCDPTDIYWRGYKKAPDKDTYKKIYLSHLEKLPENADELPNELVKTYLIKIKIDDNILTVGFIHLRFKGSTSSIGISVLQEFQGRGIATKALGQAIEMAEKYNKEVIITCRDDNIASQTMLKRHAFVPTDETETENGLTFRIYKRKR